MKLSKPSSKYRTISLSDPLVEEIRKITNNDPKYRSVADYVNQAIREKMFMETSKELQEAYALRDNIQKRNENWDKEGFEYQLTHGTPYNIKEMRKNLIRSYKKEKKNIPDWLSAPEKPTVQLSQSKFNEILQRIEKLEKKDKKKLS